MIQIGPYTIYVPDSFEDDLLNCDESGDFDVYHQGMKHTFELQVEIQGRVADLLGIEMYHVEVVEPWP